MIDNWTFTEIDRKIAEEIADFLPERIFDSHAHIWRVSDWKDSPTGVFAEGPREITIDVWRKHVGRQMGEARLAGGLFLGVPMCDIDRMNDFLVEQLSGVPANCN